jgi:formate C-acetyltransferase
MAEITLEDLSLRDYGLTPHVSDLKDVYFKAIPEVCVERPRLLTRYYLDHGLFENDRVSVLDKARAYRYILENRAHVVAHTRFCNERMKREKFKDTSLFAGSTTSKFKGVPLYPEFLALQLWQELWTLTRRDSNPYFITDKEVEELNYEIFPRWIDRNIQELTRARCYRENFEKYGLEKQAPEMKVFEKLRYFITAKPKCISHTAPDFSRAVGEGLRGIIDDAESRGRDARDECQKEFYAAVVEAMEGIIAYSRNLAGDAKKLAHRERDPARKKEFEAIAAIHDRVPERPAETFREALTTVWICWTAVHLENPNVGLSLGRLDQVLYPAYRRDMDEGKLTIEEAVELLCCLWLKIGDHVPAIPAEGEKLFAGTGSNQAITIGGVDGRGLDAVNDLTYVMLRATELMMLRDPNLNARYYPGVNDEDYLKRICEANINTGATPALHNDKAVINTLTGKGETLEHARDYAVIGCVEPESNGRGYGHSAAILMNLTAILELALYDGKDRYSERNTLISEETGDPTTFRSFEEFQRAFQAQMSWFIKQATALNNIFGRTHQDFQPTPILSSLFEGPMSKGQDLIMGGAVYNSSGVTVIGLADVADSLSAIQRVVFEEKAVSFKELLDALDRDFEGYEALQKRLANPEKTPKYGNEDAAADANAARLIEFLDGELGRIDNYRGGKYRLGFWTMTNHAGFGMITKATPNGRKDYENFASGITPVSGVTPSLTPALNSVAGLPARCIASGMALNLKYTPEAGEAMLDNFVATVSGYFDDLGGGREGGMEIQFNVTDRAKFEDAVARPEEYPELLVRVSGYTAYFKDLNPQMQKEIIDRTEYLLSTRRAVPHKPFPLPRKDG